MFTSAVRHSPVRAARRTNREYECVHDETVLLAHPDRLMPCSVSSVGSLQRLRRNVPNLTNIDEYFRMELPLLVRNQSKTREPKELNFESSITTNLSADAGLCSGLRFVHSCWRDEADYPKFTLPLHDTSAIIGRNVALDVRVSGFPQCEVRWFKDGQPLAKFIQREDNVQLLRYNNTRFVLNIRCVQPVNAGVYSCLAYNCEGAIRTSAYVSVQPHRIVDL